MLELQKFLCVAFLLFSFQVLDELLGTNVLQVNALHGLLQIDPGQTNITVLQCILGTVKNGLEM